MKDNSFKLALSPSQAAEAVGLGRTRIFELIRTGQLKARKSGRRTLILSDDLKNYLERLPMVLVSESNN